MSVGLKRECSSQATITNSMHLIGTLGFHREEAYPTSELYLGPPQHTQEELGRSSPHLLVLEVQEQTTCTICN